MISSLWDLAGESHKWRTCMVAADLEVFTFVDMKEFQKHGEARGQHLCSVTATSELYGGFSAQFAD